MTDQRAAARKNGRNASISRGGTATSLGLGASIVMNISLMAAVGSASTERFRAAIAACKAQANSLPCFQYKSPKVGRFDLAQMRTDEVQFCE